MRSRRGGWTGLLGKGDSARGQGASPGRCPPDGSRAKPSLPVPWLGLSPLRQGPKETCRAYHLLRYTMLHKIFIRTSIQVRRHTSSISPAEKIGDTTHALHSPFSSSRKSSSLSPEVHESRLSWPLVSATSQADKNSGTSSKVFS